MNAWFLNSVLPMTAVEDAVQWEDRALSKTTFVLENGVSSPLHCFEFLCVVKGLSVSFQLLSSTYVQMTAERTLYLTSPCTPATHGTSPRTDGI